MNKIYNEAFIYPGLANPLEPPIEPGLVIDQEIRENIRAIGNSVLTIGCDLAKIKEGKHFLDLGYKNMTAYVEALSSSTKTDRGTIFRWLAVGKAYFKHREELEKIGFDSGDGPTKLRFLDKALALWPREQVFLNLKTMTYLQFAAYAKGTALEEPGDQPFWEDLGCVFKHKGRRAVIVNKSLDKKTNDMLLSATRMAFRALERKGKVVAVHLNNRREVRLFKIEARRIREEIRRRTGG